MITSLLLTLSMLGQYNSTKLFWTVPPHIKDAVFIQIQENWVFQQRKSAIYQWSSVLCQEDADLLDTLDAEKMSVRRHGRLCLKKMGFGAIKLCSWGLNAKSKELQQVCSNHFISLLKCTYCKGSGRVTRVIENYTPYEVACQGCKSSGSFFWYHKYNFDTGGEDWTLRDIFAPTVSPMEEKGD
jgi:hypothetical protein